MSHLYGFLSLNRTRIPFNDSQDLLNDQFHVLSNFTGICLFLIILSYGKTILWYFNAIRLVRSGWVTISYSKDMSEILYLESGTFGGEFCWQYNNSIVIIEHDFITQSVFKP